MTILHLNPAHNIRLSELSALRDHTPILYIPCYGSRAVPFPPLRLFLTGKTPTPVMSEEPLILLICEG
jgi:hypothetical protein